MIIAAALTNPSSMLVIAFVFMLSLRIKVLKPRATSSSSFLTKIFPGRDEAKSCKQ
jgi:hypothetical protein